MDRLVDNGKLKISNSNSQKQEIEKDNRDEYYVLDLCDEVLNMKSLRQYKFDFLLGDPDKNGKCKKLPVDAYYKEFGLVIEYREKQHAESVKFFNKSDKMTVSGVHRGEQRKIYDKRRQRVFSENKIKLIEISYFDFKYNSKKRIKRNRNEDIEIIKKILGDIAK